MKKDTLKDFLNTLSDSIDKGKIELFEKIIDGSRIEQFDSPEEFFYAILYPWEKFISGYLQSELKANSNVEFIFKHSQYIDRHFANLFIKYEGGTCSSDKSRTIVNRLLQFYATGEPIEFNYGAEYTYHLPKIIFKNHQDIIDFYEGLKSLLYGHPEKYLESLKKIISEIA